MNTKNLTLCFLMITLAACSKLGVQENTGVEDRLAKLQTDVLKVPTYDNLTQLGLELSKRGRHGESANAFRYAYSLAPNALAASNVCAELNSVNQFYLAAKWCEKSVALEPQFVLAKNNLEFSKKNLAIAEKNAATALTQKQFSYDQRLVNQGMFLYQAGDFDAANAAWSKVKSSSNLYWIALNNKASSEIQSGHLDEASKLLDKVVEMKPAESIVKNNVKWLADQRANRVQLPLVP